jgi:hypothetical protein
MAVDPSNQKARLCPRAGRPRYSHLCEVLRHGSVALVARLAYMWRVDEWFALCFPRSSEIWRVTMKAAQFRQALDDLDLSQPAVAELGWRWK